MIFQGLADDYTALTWLTHLHKLQNTFNATQSLQAYLMSHLMSVAKRVYLMTYQGLADDHKDLTWLTHLHKLQSYFNATQSLQALLMSHVEP